MKDVNELEKENQELKAQLEQVQAAANKSEKDFQHALHDTQHQFEQEITKRDAQLARLCEKVRELEKSKKSIVNR